MEMTVDHPEELLVFRSVELLQRLDDLFIYVGMLSSFRFSETVQFVVCSSYTGELLNRINTEVACSDY